MRRPEDSRRGHARSTLGPRLKGIRLIAWALSALALWAVAWVGSAVASGPSGSLVQTTAPYGCLAVENMASCSRIRPISGDLDIANSAEIGPDGRTLYVFSSGGPPRAMAVLRVDDRGRLAQLPGADGCFVEIAGRGCQLVGKLPYVAAFAPDGRFAYGVVQDALEIFARDLATGALRETGEIPGCDRDCAGQVLVPDPSSLTFAPDDRFAYGGGLQALAYHPDSGLLTPASPVPDCFAVLGFADPPLDHCTVVELPIGGERTFAPDGQALYITGDDGLAVMRRDPATGVLSVLAGANACFAAATGPSCRTAPGLIGNIRAAALTPDGRYLYVASESTRGCAVLDCKAAYRVAITVFRRRGESLQPVPGRGGCVSTRGLRDCRTLHGASNTIIDLKLSPDASTAYVQTADSLLTLRADPKTGAVRQLAGPRGCSQDKTAERPYVHRGCRRVDAARLPTLTPDGRFAYIANPWDSRIDVLSRNPRTG
jgi:hypothetical protein